MNQIYLMQSEKLVMYKGYVMEFKDELKKYQVIINDELEKYFTETDVPEKVLNESMRYSLLAGGKRIRPVLTLATYNLFDDDYSKCMTHAVALEMIHNFSLIHDDLPGIDNDDFRHGKPTNHKKFNEAVAILAGDGLLNRAYSLLSEDLLDETDENMNYKKRVLFSEFSTAISKMIKGEYVDTEYEQKDITEDMLEYIHTHKTGALLRLPVRIGAILGKASDDELERLTAYSEKIGLAFQIKDDILSEEGDEKVLGKPVGNDKEMGKATYVSKYGLEGAKDELNRVIESAKDDLKPFGAKAEFLSNLADYIANRNK